MAIVKPFQCVRPAANVADRVAALPYDVYNRAEATVETAREPLSFLKIDRAETQLDASVDTYAPEVYAKALALYEEAKRDGVFETDLSPKYYIYELTMNGRVQSGLVSVASIDDYVNGVILRHENTRAEKEADRIRHVDTLSAQTGPIFLAYRANPTVKAETEKAKEKAPLYDFTSPDGIRHRVFEIADPQSIETIEKAFESVDHLYIADGHHRAASAVKVGLKRRAEHPDFTGKEEFNYFLSVLFPDEELMIMPYNRVLRSLNGYTEEGLLQAIADAGFEVEEKPEAFQPDQKAVFGLYLGGKWYAVKTPDCLRSEDPVKGLDVSLLQDLILEPMLGIQDPKTDHNIDFVGGIRGLAELEKRCREDAKIAFSMYPTSIAELLAVADAGLLMPPKSTWFEPKLRSGLFIHEFER